MTRLLALDLSSNVGVARFGERGTVPTFDTIRLQGPDLTYKIGQFQAWLYEEYEKLPFLGIAFERPILTPTDTVELLNLLYGLVGIVHGFIGCMRKDGVHLLWAEVTVPEVKIALTGSGKAKKDEILHAARTVFNWPVTDDHQADSGGVGLVAYRRFWPKRGPA